MTCATPSSLRRAILALGFSGIVAHTVLLRELLVLFAGNEFSLGVIIGGWIVAEAAGALAAGRMIRRGPPPAGSFALLTLLFCAVFPATVAAIRAFKLLAGLPPDQGLGIGTVGGAALLLQLPAAFLHGALFILACALLARIGGNPERAPGRVYTLETAGTIAGGLLTGLVIVPYTSAMLAAALVTLVNAAVLLPLTRPRRTLTAACLLLGAGLLVGAPWLEAETLRRQWQGRELAGVHNSPYQNLAVVRNGRQLTFYGDGLPLFSIPDPDIAAVEEFTHLPLLAHPAPKRVLILGGGAGGSVAEALRHPSVTRIDYVEFDPWLLRTVADHAPAETRAALDDPRVVLHHDDPRRFLHEVRDRYDVILLGIPLPATLQGNRFYTAEFFALAAKALTADGLLAATASGSPTYYGPELLAINAGLLQTLKAAFSGIRVIPGDSNLFLASPSPALTGIDAGLLGERLAARRPATRLITPEHLAYLLDPERRQWFLDTVGGAGAVNRDFSPQLLFDNLAYSTVLFTPRLREALAGLQRLSLPPLALGIVLAGLGAGLLARRKPASVYPLVIAGTGFTAMLIELVLFCAFQVLCGAIFRDMALLLSAFMAGLAAGSWLATDGPLSNRDDRRLLLATEGGLLLFAALLGLLFGSSALPPAEGWRAHLLIVPLLTASGLLTGLQFPLATRLQQARPGRGTPADGTGSVGAVYGADLIGGCLGGLLGGAILLPVLGLGGSCLVAVAVKTASLVVLSLSAKTR